MRTMETPAIPSTAMAVAGAPAGLASEMATARSAQVAWAAWPVEARLAVVRRLRRALAHNPEPLLAAAGAGRPVAEVLSSEVVPFADACRFLEREAAALLAPCKPTGARPAWLAGVELELRREPLGVVLVLGPSNYPLLLPGVQILQALAAGNAVLFKPGRDGLFAGRELARLLAAAGLPGGVFQVLLEDEETARRAIEAGPDHVVLTGSAATGRAVLAALAPRLVPATLELGGCDALFVLSGARRAHLERAAQAVRFALELNGGATCIAPRRAFVPQSLAEAFEERVAELTRALPPPSAVRPEATRRARELAAEAVAGGARLAAGTLDPAAPFRPLVVAGARPGMRLLAADLLAPVVSIVPVADEEEALLLAAGCPYALGASVFGPEEEARAFAGRVRAGTVVVNDAIVPTADPRLPFGGRGESGHGTTRGAEGLLALTAVKAVAVRRGRFAPHLDPRRAEGAAQERDAELFRAYLALVHGEPWRDRPRALLRILRAMAGRRRAASPTAAAREEVRP